MCLVFVRSSLVLATITKMRAFSFRGCFVQVHAVHSSRFQGVSGRYSAIVSIHHRGSRHGQRPRLPLLSPYAVRRAVVGAIL
jgi:hypothetical protein